MKRKKIALCLTVIMTVFPFTGAYAKEEPANETMNITVNSQEQENTNTVYLGNATVTRNSVYGNGSLKLRLSGARGASDTADKIDVEYLMSLFNYIEEPLDVNCATGDVEALTAYLEKNVKGFDRATCSVELINNSGDNIYEVHYRLLYHGFETPYKVSVTLGGNDYPTSYYSNLDEFKAPEETSRAASFYADMITEEQIEDAKTKAIGKGIEDCTVKEQEVAKKIDENFRPYLFVGTVWADDLGGMFMTGYDYYLD